jgi:hypothetical protein
LTVRQILCHLIVEEWTTLGRFPVDSAWLSLLTQVDNNVLLSHRVLIEFYQFTVKLGEESKKTTVLEVEVFGKTVS